ncbi:hypothetical protein GBF38_011305, partial [Nibea albiflora]
MPVSKKPATCRPLAATAAAGVSSTGMLAPPAAHFQQRQQVTAAGASATEMPAPPAATTT